MEPEHSGTAPAREPIDVLTLLGVIEEFETASLALLAWEFAVPESALRAQWQACIARGLIAEVGVDPFSGDQTYALTSRGTARLRPRT